MIDNELDKAGSIMKDHLWNAISDISTCERAKRANFFSFINLLIFRNAISEIEKYGMEQVIIVRYMGH